LEIALDAAEGQGARTELLALDELDLPLFRPGTRLDDYPSSVERFIEISRGAEAMLWSTGAYHGTLAGATKNALDYYEFLADEGYLDGVPIGLISTSGGHMAGVSALDALVHTAHALRATVLPLKVPIGKA
jgi:FMN reductase